MDALTVRDSIIAALLHLNADITDGPPEKGKDGRIRRTVIVNVDAGTLRNRRAAGGTAHTTRTVTCLIVAPSRDSCLALTEDTRDALDGLRIDADILRDVSYTGDPVPEPGTTPARWSKALAFTSTTRRSTR